MLLKRSFWQISQLQSFAPQPIGRNTVFDGGYVELHDCWENDFDPMTQIDDAGLHDLSLSRSTR